MLNSIPDKNVLLLTSEGVPCRGDALVPLSIKKDEMI